MTHQSYIELLSSDGLVGGKFRVVYPGYKRQLEKSGTLNRTVGGHYDKAAGGIYETHIYTIRVRETEPVAGYGSKATLEALFRLNAPNAVPSDVITFRTHFYPTEAQKTCYMEGNFEEQTMGIMIEGETAWFHVQAVLRVIPA